MKATGGFGMKWRFCTAFAAVVLASGDRSAAQAPPAAATAAEVRVAVTALEWFGDLVANAGKTDVTLVVSQVTNGMRSSLTPEGVISLARGERLHLGLSNAVLEQLRRRSRLSVATCDTLSGTHSLCGIARPWIWVRLSSPAIEGDSAVIAVEEIDLAFSPDSTEEAVQVTSYDIRLRRENGVWRVLDTQRGTTLPLPHVYLCGDSPADRSAALTRISSARSRRTA
jgi:hypothetical protein